MVRVFYVLHIDRFNEPITRKLLVSGNVLLVLEVIELVDVSRWAWMDTCFL